TTGRTFIMKHFRSLVKVLLSVLLTSTAAPRLAYGQSSAGSTITFESLKAKQAPQPATSRPIVVKKTDTIRVERHRVDTVRVERLRIDTVRIERLRVDTVRVPVAVAPSVTAALSVTPTPLATAPPNSASTIAANPYVAPTF